MIDWLRRDADDAPTVDLGERDLPIVIVRHPRARRMVLRLAPEGEAARVTLPRWGSTAEAIAFARSRADWLAAQIAARVPAPDLRLSRARRRWGSCASDGTVRINWRLVMAPDHVRRSVVAHEVAHLLHFDHGPAFKAALVRIFDGDLPAADRWLRDRGRTLHAPFG